MRREIRSAPSSRRAIMLWWGRQRSEANRGKVWLWRLIWSANCLEPACSSAQTYLLRVDSRRLRILIFPAAMRGTGEGSYPWDLKPKSTMTNGTVLNAVKDVDGRTLTVSYEGQEKKVSVPEGIPIVTFGPATEADLKPGATFFVPAQRGEDGSLETELTHRCKAGKPNRSAGQSGLHDYLCLIEMLPKKGVTISVYLQRRWRFFSARLSAGGLGGAQCATRFPNR